MRTGAFRIAWGRVPGSHRCLCRKARRQISSARHGWPSRRKHDSARTSRRRPRRESRPRCSANVAQARRRQDPDRGLRAGSCGTKAAMSHKPVSIKSGKELPLAGWRILVTRASRQAIGLSFPLRELGAEVIEVPTIEIRPPQSFAALDYALFKIDHYDTMILTSVNGVETLFERYHRQGLPIADMQHLMVVAIGPATAAAI